MSRFRALALVGVLGVIVALVLTPSEPSLSAEEARPTPVKAEPQAPPEINAQPFRLPALPPLLAPPVAVDRADASTEARAQAPRVEDFDAGTLFTLEPVKPAAVARASPEVGSTDSGAAEPPRAPDPRFGVRWGQPGLCPGQDNDSVLARREALYARFQISSVGGAKIRHDPSVPHHVLEEVAQALGDARLTTNKLVGWSLSAPSPAVIVYRDLAQLQSVACVNQSAIGYYDGSIHLTDDPNHGSHQVQQTIIHEYTHHVLLSIGVRKPMWFHEGLAMHAAGETWFNRSDLGLVRWLEQSHLPFDALVPAFPHTADEKFASAAYYQSLMMTEFLAYRRGPDIFRALSVDLASGAVTPQEAFARGAGLSPSALDAHWAAFLQIQK